MNIVIKNVVDKNQKQSITKNILESLQEWFEIKSSREQYIKESSEQHYFSATINDKPIGFIALKETSKDTLELAVMGVLKERHKKGIGKKLFEEAKTYAANKGYSFIQVKTVQMGKYKVYDNTNKFYLALGFKELEVLPTLWDKDNPCQIYIMAIK